MANMEDHHPAVVAIVAEHRDWLAEYAGSDKETARLAEALLWYDNNEHEPEEVQEVDA